ncbi:MAG: IS200/IS605 family transposase [Kiritimatiellia bacterium]|jgi:putative transposase
MPQSFFELYAHVVFSTKNRERWLDAAIRDRVHAYLATVMRNEGCPYVHVGGVEDHVHLLAGLGKQVVLVDLVGRVKQESSKFVKTLGERYAGFYWQAGYGAFSVGPTQREDVVRYLDRQAEHHKRRSFQEELRAFLDKYGVSYDERYMWD